MADVIDRDALVSNVSGHVISMSVCLSKDERDGMERMFNTIMNDIQIAPAVNRWIPCSERMPENRTGIIFTVDRGHPFACVGYRINSEREGLKLQRWFDKLSGLNFSDYDVKAWMPMPDAYKPHEKEDET